MAAVAVVPEASPVTHDTIRDLLARVKPSAWPNGWFDDDRMHHYVAERERVEKALQAEIDQLRDFREALVIEIAGLRVELQRVGTELLQRTGKP